MKRTLAPPLLLVLSGYVLAQQNVNQPSDFTLAQALVLLHQAPSVLQAELSLRSAQTTLQAARSGLGVTPWSGAQNSLRSAERGLTLTQVQAQNALNSAYLNLVQQYFNVVLAQRDLEIVQKSLVWRQRQWTVSQAQQNLGNATQLDVTNAQNTLAASQQNWADAQAQVKLASVKLSTLVGVPSDRPLAPVNVPSFKSGLAELQSGLSEQSAVVAARNDLNLAALNVKLSDNDFTPARTLQDAKTALANAQRSLESTQKTAQQNLASAYQSVQNNYALLVVVQSREQAASKAEAQDSTRLRSGTISPVELQNTRLALKKAQANRLQAQSSVLNGLAALSAAAGRNLTGFEPIIVTTPRSKEQGFSVHTASASRAPSPKAPSEPEKRNFTQGGKWAGGPNVFLQFHLALSHISSSYRWPCAAYGVELRPLRGGGLYPRFENRGITPLFLNFKNQASLKADFRAERVEENTNPSNFGGIPEQQWNAACIFGIGINASGGTP